MIIEKLNFTTEEKYTVKRFPHVVEGLKFTNLLHMALDKLLNHGNCTVLQVHTQYSPKTLWLIKSIILILFNNCVPLFEISPKLLSPLFLAAD